MPFYGLDDREGHATASILAIIDYMMQHPAGEECEMRFDAEHDEATARLAVAGYVSERFEDAESHLKPFIETSGADIFNAKALEEGQNNGINYTRLEVVLDFHKIPMK
jgi:hypothetical protein